MKTVANILTCDLEDWYHTAIVNARRDDWDQYPQRIVDATRIILELLEKTRTKITFFVLGYVAEKYPHLIEEIHGLGHEIASHSYAHQLIYDLTPEQFDEDVKKSIAILSSLSAAPVRGFRAPSWSIHRRQEWVFEVLWENGIRYDSSLFPYKTFLYGDNHYSRFGHQILYGSEKRVFELPPSVAKFGPQRVPFAGGFYLRVLPYRLVRKCIHSFNRHQQPAVLYFHPWEIDEDQPRIKLGMKGEIIQYYKLSSMRKKLERLLQEFRFIPVWEYIARQNLSGREPGETVREDTVGGSQ